MSKKCEQISQSINSFESIGTNQSAEKQTQLVVKKIDRYTWFMSGAS